MGIHAEINDYRNDFKCIDCGFPLRWYPHSKQGRDIPMDLGFIGWQLLNVHDFMDIEFDKPIEYHQYGYDFITKTSCVEKILTLCYKCNCGIEAELLIEDGVPKRIINLKKYR
jgi:hypothetical protein